MLWSLIWEPIPSSKNHGRCYLYARKRTCVHMERKVTSRTWEYDLRYLINNISQRWDISISLCTHHFNSSTPMCRIYASVNWVNIGSDNGLSPDRCQAIIWIDARILLTGTLGTHLNEIRNKIQTFHSWKCIWNCRLRNGDHFVGVVKSKAKWERKHIIWQSGNAAISRVWYGMRNQSSAEIRASGIHLSFRWSSRPGWQETHFQWRNKLIRAKIALL